MGLSKPIEPPPRAVAATLPAVLEPPSAVQVVHAQARKTSRGPEPAAQVSRHDPDAISRAFETGDYPYTTNVSESTISTACCRCRPSC